MGELKYYLITSGNKAIGIVTGYFPPKVGDFCKDMEVLEISEGTFSSFENAGILVFPPVMFGSGWDMPNWYTI